WMSLILTARDRRFWDGGPNLRAMTLTTDSGLYFDANPFLSRNEHYSLNSMGHEPFCETFQIWACLHEFPTEWVELEYSYGEPWSVRVDWEAVT
ncbi:MAG: hypothetical protein RR288_06660, partial [Oscillibacter sp.]